MSSLGLLNSTINTPIGSVFAPKGLNDVRRLDQRISLAVNAFNYMYRNLYSGPNMARNWSAVTNVLTQRLDPATLPQPAIPNI